MAAGFDRWHLKRKRHLVLLASLVSVRRRARSSPAPRCYALAVFLGTQAMVGRRGKAWARTIDRPRCRSADQPDAFAPQHARRPGGWLDLSINLAEASRRMTVACGVF